MLTVIIVLKGHSGSLTCAPIGVIATSAMFLHYMNDVGCIGIFWFKQPLSGRSLSGKSWNMQTSTGSYAVHHKQRRTQALCT